jgi:hypothetical protein
MTIKLPQIDFGDKILKALNKKRGIRLPSEAYEKYGPYVYATAQKECFWKALVRAKDAELPEGYIDYFSFVRGIHDHNSPGE